MAMQQFCLWTGLLFFLLILLIFYAVKMLVKKSP